jgi:hypothetical protein
MTTALCLKQRRRSTRAAKIPATAMYYCPIFLPLFCLFPVLSFYVSPLRRNSHQIQFTKQECEKHAFSLFSSRGNDARTWTQQRSSGSPFNPQHNRVDSHPQRRQKMKPMPVTGYDARAIEDYYDMRPLEVGWRLNSLGFPLLGKGCARYLAKIMNQSLTSLNCHAL